MRRRHEPHPSGHAGVERAGGLLRDTRQQQLEPLGPPPRLRTIQAIAAIQKSTACKILFSSMYRNISGQVFSQDSCG